MLEQEKIKVGEKYIQALVFGLLEKSIIILRGEKGYIMCGYLNLEAAEKARDVAVRITGISNIQGALVAQVESCTSFAAGLGIYKGQPVREVLKIIV